MLADQEERRFPGKLTGRKIDPLSRVEGVNWQAAPEPKKPRPRKP